MERHPSAVKRHRQSLRRQTHNRWWKSRVRAVSKAVQEAVGQKDKAKAGATLKAAVREIGKAKSNGVLHANTASRKVARLSSLVSSLK